ncbi:MAG: hypothetical protein JRI59_04730 [Deltaproteobacteria bacterium]|nr:hypothetical protein [Deltaproteobacteria bacterium]
MAEIKSALEIALEKAERLGRASKEELLQDKYQEKGRQIAVKYLKEEAELEEELAKLPPEAQDKAQQAVKEVLLRNVALPRDEVLDPRAVRALEGLLLVASNKKAMAQLKKEVEQLWQQFLLARNTALQQLKASFSQQLRGVTQALEAQLGQRVRVEVEYLPQFQEEWRKFETSLIQQYEPILEDYKAGMLRL